MKKISYMLFLLAFIAIVPALKERLSYEQKNREVAIAVSPGYMHPLDTLGVIKEYSMYEWKEFGWLDNLRPGMRNPFKNKISDNLILVFDDRHKFLLAEKALSLKFKDIMNTIEENALFYICLPGYNWSETEETGLGPVRFATLDEGKSILSLMNDDRVNKEYIDWVLDEYRGNMVFFYGKEVMGYPDNIFYLLKKLDENKMPVLIEEFHRSKGLEKIKYASRVIRMHSLPKELSTKEFINRAKRAVKERGFRVLYVNRDLGEDLYEELKSKLAAAGYLIAVPEYIQVNSLFSDIAAYSVPLLLLGLAVYSGSRIMYVLFFTVLILNIFLGSLMTSFLSLICALSFPVATFMLIKDERTGFISSLLIYISIGLGCGLIIAALGARSEYILKIVQLHGIKLALILPLLINLIISTEKPLVYLKKDISRLELLLISSFLLVFAVYIIRSTNNSAGFVSGMELKLRAALENVFIYRPRFKEFLIGHPLLLFSLFFIKVKKSPDKVWLYLLALSLIGQISVINTFMHLHSPLLVTVYRTFAGILLGFGMGSLLLLSVYICRKILRLQY